MWAGFCLAGGGAGIPTSCTLPIPVAASALGDVPEGGLFSTFSVLDPVPAQAQIGAASEPQRSFSLAPMCGSHTSVFSIVLVVLVGSLLSPYFLLSTVERVLPSVTVESHVPKSQGKVLAQGIVSSLGLMGDIVMISSSAEGFTFVLPQLSGALPSSRNMVGVSEVSFTPVPWVEVKGSIFEIPCALAVATVQAFGSAVWPQSSPISPSVVDRGPTFLERSRGWEQGQALMAATDSSLCSTLRAIISSREVGSAYLAECEERIWDVTVRPALLDVPLSRRGRGDPHRDDSLSRRPFSRRFSPTATLPLQPPAPQPATDFRPGSYAEILDEEALADISRFIRTEASNLCAMRKFGSAVAWFPPSAHPIPWCSAVQRQLPLIVGQDQFLPRARGVVWDCRGLGWDVPQPCSPLDFTSPPISDLNSAYINSKFSSWPDQELISMLVYGVHLKADVPLQFVFCSHLVSLPEGFASVDSEILQFIEKGWYELSSLLPFLPCRVMAQGSTPRKNDPSRFRRTSDGGGPRVVSVDKAGVAAVPLNVAIGLHDTLDSEWDCLVDKWSAKEVKPRIEDKMHDDAILRDLALFWFHEPIVGFVDDFRSYFNQIPVAPAEYWKLNHIWQTPDSTSSTPPFSGASFGIVSEFRLGFGLSASPNVAQRFAELMLHDFRVRFDSAESQFFSRIFNHISGECFGANEADRRSAVGRQDGLTDACRWIIRRRELSRLTGNNELRAYSIHVYTDDVVLTVVGSERMARALSCWHQTTSAFNVDMASAAKRQLGASVSWLGCNFYLPLGVVSAHPNKVTRARQAISLILEGAGIGFADYRALLGLLEHLMPVLGLDRSWMYHLYGDNFRRGSQLGPTTRMVFHALQNDRFRAWLQVLLREAGSYFSAALSISTIPLPPPPSSGWPGGASGISPAPARFHLFSDAANEGHIGGLGGWAHGDWWHIELSSEDCQLFHITALEFLAVCVNFILWGAILQGHQVAMYADALASVQVLLNGAAHSPMMQLIHLRLKELPEFASVWPSIQVDHVFGEFNVLADAASRNRPAVIHALALQLGIPARKVALPDRVNHFLQHIREDARALRGATSTAALELEQYRSKAFSSNFAGDGPAEKESFFGGDVSRPSKRHAFINLPFASRVGSIYGAQTNDRPLRGEEGGGPSVPPNVVTTPPSCAQASGPETSLWQRVHERLLSPRLLAILGPPRDIATPRTSEAISSSLSLISRESSSLVALSPLARSIMNDTSIQGLHPRDPRLLWEFDALVGHAIESSVCSGTSKKNELGMRRWGEFVDLWGTPPLREDDPAQLLLNSFLLASFLIWLAREVRGKGGRALAKPGTLMGYLYAVKRHHNLHGRRFEAFLLVKPVLRSITSQYAQRFGPEALLPVRSEPFSGPVIRRLLEASNDNLALALRDFPVLRHDSWFYHSVRGAIATSWRGGHRKGELVLKHDETFDNSHLSWASLFFIIKGIIHRYPSLQLLASMSVGDYVGLLPGPCKNDPWGIYFGAHPVYYSFNPNDPTSSGVLLRDMARVCRPESSRLRSTPLFTTDPTFRPMRHRHLEVVLFSLLRVFLSASEVTKYSWHSFRIGLACSLLAAGASDAIIMALCRWRSVSSLRIYARLNADDYTRFIDDASELNLTSVQGPNLTAIPEQSGSSSGASVLPVPGSLPAHLYAMVDEVTGPSAPELSTARLLQLAAALPELDADNFAAAFSRLDVDAEPAGDDSDGEEVGSQ